MRTFLNENRALVQKILILADTHRTISVAPPPVVGGYMTKVRKP